MTGYSFHLDAFLPYILAVVSTDVSHAFAKKYRTSHGITRAEWRIICHLSQLAKNESISVRDLEQRVHLEKSKVSRTVSRMEKQGLLRKNPDPDDARLLQIQLTDEGQKTFAELVPVAHDFENALASRLTAEENKQLRSILAKLRTYPEV